jgi:hypothetical protein
LVDKRARAILQEVLVTPSSTAAAAWSYVLVPDACDKYDAIHMAIFYHSVRQKRYSAYLLFDSVARGPFQPAYADNVPWIRAFVSKLRTGTHLAGSAIRCGHGQPGAPAAFYVEDFAMAFDTVGLNALQEVLVSAPCAARAADTAVVARLWSQKVLLWVWSMPTAVCVRSTCAIAPVCCYARFGLQGVGVTRIWLVRGSCAAMPILSQLSRQDPLRVRSNDMHAGAQHRQPAVSLRRR